MKFRDRLSNLFKSDEVHKEEDENRRVIQEVTETARKANEESTRYFKESNELYKSSSFKNSKPQQDIYFPQKQIDSCFENPDYLQKPPSEMLKAIRACIELSGQKMVK